MSSGREGGGKHGGDDKQEPRSRSQGSQEKAQSGKEGQGSQGSSGGQQNASSGGSGGRQEASSGGMDDLKQQGNKDKDGNLRQHDRTHKDESGSGER